MSPRLGFKRHFLSYSFHSLKQPIILLLCGLFAKKKHFHSMPRGPTKCFKTSINFSSKSVSKLFSKLFQLALPEHFILNKLSNLYLSENAIENLDDIHHNFLSQVQHLDLSRSVFLHLFLFAAPLFSIKDIWRHPWLVYQVYRLRNCNYQ